MTPHQRELAIVRVGAAMFQVNRASTGLRAKRTRRGVHAPSPTAYYELNRIWTDLSALKAKLEAGGRAAAEGAKEGVGG